MYHRLELSSDESQIAVLSAAMFGFSPTRPAWYRFRKSVLMEEERNRSIAMGKVDHLPEDTPVGWWTGWLGIGQVTDEEAGAMAECVERAYRWYLSHPGEVPGWFEPFPRWNWEGVAGLIRDQSLVASLPRTTEFLKAGAFFSQVRQSPYAVILSR